MGACMSSSNEELQRKKHSQNIDKQLEEDSKRLRRECKILLLGMPKTSRLAMRSTDALAPARQTCLPI